MLVDTTKMQKCCFALQQFRIQVFSYQSLKHFISLSRFLSKSVSLLCISVFSSETPLMWRILNHNLIQSMTVPYKFKFSFKESKCFWHLGDNQCANIRIIEIESTHTRECKHPFARPCAHTNIKNISSVVLQKFSLRYCNMIVNVRP